MQVSLPRFKAETLRQFTVLSYVKCRALGPWVKGKTGCIYFGVESIASAYKRKYMLYKCAPTVHACIDIGDAQYWITDNLILVCFDIEVSSFCN